MDIAIYTLIGFLLGIGALLLMRALAPRLGLIDIPDARKNHGEPVPVVGGVSIFLALCCSVLFMSEIPVGMEWLLLAGAVLIAIGILDDRYQLRASLRMLGQAGVALIMVFGAGLVIGSIGAPFFFGEIHAGVFAVPFTILVTLTVINAINMTDGMDGLACSFSLASLLPMLLLLLVAGRWAEAGFLAALMGAMLAFLAFNFPMVWNRRVRTFMGDAGSTFLGLVIVWVGISINQGEEQLISPVAGLWFIAAPVHDLFASAIRRARKGKGFWIPDLGHAHHIFLKAGFTSRQALRVMVFVALCHGLIGLSGPFLGVPDGVLFTLWMAAGLLHIWVVQKAWVFSKIFEIIRTDL